ncbi:hypothetical protein CE143_15425 [Photorhabdus luminescens]|uniref:Uncharacterized protein n=1 Tax=Photorhabdus akhurstii TaxID=171438 RepID=A0ABX8LVI8_9GAMM|nr:hypothetical protein B0X70_15430 [Photorhabdus akhurstii]UJD76208.1 hypothetical protein CE143_15425 [Photorhabdus luminescens]
MYFEGFGWYVFMSLFVCGWLTVPIGLISSYAAYKYKNPIMKIICTLIALVFLIPVIAFLLGSMGLVEF